MGTVFPEVAVAARWWADKLARPGLQDNGDADQSLFASWASLSTVQANGGTVFIGDEYDRFVAALEHALMTHITNGGWERAKTDAGWGSYSRTIGVDYGPDSVLQAALDEAVALTPQRAAMFSLLWPIKTTMWINPGRVSVRNGYGALDRDLFVEEPRA